jgi:GT2 family glycosyltransferase/2-polyprenyl-3-methyl-5-hydroxy-6-metoxy-1,4-benzoquinol methylase/Flp pilus assembly protein TadD
MNAIHFPFDVVMVWYQNDWRLYGRRNEMIARTLIKHKQVRTILHIEPPLCLDDLGSNIHSKNLDNNIHTNLKRISLYNDRGVFIYTPHVVKGLNETRSREFLHRQIQCVMDRCVIENMVLWLYPPHAFSEFMLHLFKDKARLIVSDCVDDHRQYAVTEKDRLAIEKRYEKIVGASDIVFCVSQSMREEMARYNIRSFYIPNAVSSDVLGTGRLRQKPAELKQIKYPIIGYSGALSFRVDAGLLEFVAKERPNWNIVLVGTSPNKDIQHLFHLPNVYWLGPKRYDEIHDYIRYFDVCILPHVITGVTDKMHPLKLYEYLALGRPVVSTNVAGAKMFQGDVEIAYNNKEFVDAIERMLSTNSKVAQERRINRVRNYTWPDRIDEMMQLSLNVLSFKSSPQCNIKTEANKYYTFDRPDVRSSIPETAKTILDVGCAAGYLGAALKKKRECHVIGLEVDPVIANYAKERLDEVIVGNIEDKVDTLPPDFFDCVVLADVLEHLQNPGRVLEKLRHSLKENGRLIASIPNVRHWSIVRQLLEGDWNYADAGILDRTHLRFFTKKSVTRLFTKAGYTISDIRHTISDDNVAIPRSVITALVNAGIDTTSLAEEGKHYQYIISAEVRKQLPQISSIIILTFNQLQYTKQCIESIRKHTPEPHEIIFVDNGSTDGTVKWIKQLIKGNPQYRLIENHKNLGFPKGCNQGINASSGEYILLLNNDVIVTDGWLSGMLECLNSSPDIGIVGPMTDNISGIQKVSADYGSLNRLDDYAMAFRELNRYRRVPARRIVGFCMLFKHELTEKIGLFDENFGSGNFEDDDYCLRAAMEGYRNIIAGDVFIHHYGSRTFIGNRIDYSSAMAENKKIFRRKWNGIDVKSLLGKKLLSLKALETADHLSQKGLIGKSVEKFLDGIKISPDEKSIYFAISEMLIAEKQFKDALDVLQGMSLIDENLRRLVLIGYCKEGLELYEEAEEYASRVLSLDAEYAMALNLKGILEYRKGNKHAAEDFFQKAIASDPSYGESYTNLGVLKWADGQSEKALNLMERGFILIPTIMDMAIIYHSAVTQLKEFDRAERIFRSAKDLYPFNRRIAFLLIDILIQQGKNETALHEIQEAMIKFGIDDGIISAAIEVRSRTAECEIESLSEKKNTLSLCMIVKNEERHLARCLMSVKTLVGEMVVVDTGSTDGTKDIAKIFGAKVYDFEWTNDFSQARNFSILKASGEWILVLDADEVISAQDSQVIKEIVRRKGKTAAYSLITRNYVNEMTLTGWTPNDGRYSTEEAGSGWFPSKKVRLFPNDSRIQFENPVHELVESSLDRAGIKTKECKVPIHHYGKLNNKKIIVKGEDYYLLGKEKLSEKDGNTQALFELAVQATELRKYDEAVELWQRFLSLEKDISKPFLTRAYLNMGGAYLQLGRYEEALSSSKKAMEMDPDLKEAVINYSLSEFCIGDVRKVINVLENFLFKVPEYVPAAALLSSAYFIDGNKEKGLEYLNDIKKTGVNCSEYLYEYARMLFSSGNVERAMLLIDAAIENNILNKDILILFSECYKQTRN